MGKKNELLFRSFRRGVVFFFVRHLAVLLQKVENAKEELIWLFKTPSCCSFQALRREKSELGYRVVLRVHFCGNIDVKLFSWLLSRSFSCRKFTLMTESFFNENSNAVALSYVFQKFDLFALSELPLWANRILHTDLESDPFLKGKCKIDLHRQDSFPDPNAMDILHWNSYILDPNYDFILTHSIQNG